MRKIMLLIPLLIFTIGVRAQNKRDYYLIKVYHCTTQEQLSKTENFIEKAWKPAALRYGIPKVGAFKPIGNDTATLRKLYVLIPVASTEDIHKLEDYLNKDLQYQKEGEAYIQTAHDSPAYQRIEHIVLRSFSDMKNFDIPNLKEPKLKRVYELRSYESATEKLYRKKVAMFNEGGEIKLFKRLNFNAVFYGEVLAGSHMPNLMYMTSFENIDDRNEHWKLFIADPEWKKLSAMPEYQHTVSKIDIVLLHPTIYSDL